MEYRVASPGRVAVFGATGFLGRHVCAEFESRGWEVVRVARRQPPRSNAAVRMCDVTDASATGRLVREINPSLVIDALGAGHAQASWTELVQLHVVGTHNLLAAVRTLPAPAKCIIVSSSSVYGSQSGERLVETSARLPVSAYGLAKVFQEDVAAFSVRTSNGAVITMRLFNLLGPGLSDALVAGRVCRQIVAIERGAEPIVRTGTLDPERDFIDVRDAATAIMAAATGGTNGGTFNVCSGRGVAIRSLVGLFVENSRVSGIEVRSEDSSIPAGLSRQCGDASRLRSESDWAPVVPLEKSVVDMLIACRENLSI